MENTFKASPSSGYLHVVINLAIIALTVMALINEYLIALAVIPFWLLHLAGFLVLQPNKAGVLILFGAYKGSIKNNGFFWIMTA